MNKRLITVLALVFCIGLTVFYGATVADAEVVPNGVSIETVDISGLTEAEAAEAVEAYVDDLKKTKVHVMIDERVLELTLGKIGYKWTNTNVVSEAVAIGERGNVIRRYKDTLDLNNKGAAFELEMNVTEESIIKALEKACAEYNVSAENASLEFVSGGFQIIPEKTGIVVNYEETAANLYNYIMNEWNGASEIDIAADTKIDEPKYTSEDMEKVSDVAMGSYTTTFAVGSSYYNRNMNIKNGAKLLEGILLYPEEEYSLNEHLAPWTEENGYYPAGTYVDGGVTDSLGGGICQVSSTLYNALLLAEIEIVERYPHSMSVGYVPLAADAALAGDYKDLVFKNNTDAPIYVRSIYEEGAITFKVYGHDTRDAGRTVEYKSETVSTKNIKTVVEKDSSKYTDYEEVVSSGHVGYVAKLWKIVYQDGEEIDRTLVNTSTYQMSPKKVIKGTKKKEDKDKDKDKDTDKKDSDDKKTDDAESTTKKKTENNNSDNTDESEE